MKRYLHTAIVASLLLGGCTQASNTPKMLRGTYNTDIHAFNKWTGVTKATKNTPASAGTTRGDNAKRVMDDIHYGWFTKDYSYQGYDPKDHWKTPKEFNHDHGGDCEDFAIADYFEGVKAGIPEDDMEIVVGWSAIHQQMHAALRLKAGDEYFFYESIGSSPIPANLYLRTFYPAYGINRNHWEPVE